MSMRTQRLVTHLRPEDALMLIEFLDQLRDLLMQSYEDDIRAMLQEATRRQSGIRTGDLPF